MSLLDEPNREPQPLPSGTGKPGRTLRPRRRWWQRWSVRLLLAFLVCVVSLGSYYAYRHHRAAEELREAVADLDRTDPGWRLQDLEAARAVIPENENSAPVVSAAFHLLPPGWLNPKLHDRLLQVPPQERFNDEDADDLLDAMGDALNAVKEAQKLATLSRGRHPITYHRDIFSTRLPHADSTRSIMFLLQKDVLLQTQDGDLKGALRSCRALLNVARSNGDESLFIMQLVRMACVGITCQVVERVLAQGEPEPDHLLELQELLEDEERFPRLLVAARGERAAMHELLDALECGDVTLDDVADAPSSWSGQTASFLSRDYFRAQHLTVLAAQTEAVRIAALPAHERVQPAGVFDSKMRGQPRGIMHIVMPTVFGKMDKAARRTDGHLRCLIAALAAERYRRRHDCWPARLEQLVPEFLSSVPLDPQDGQPLRFQCLEDRVVFYSLCQGPGRLGMLEVYNPDEPSPPGVGVAVHLFDVPHRRQPPRAKPAIGDDDPQ